MSPPRGKPGESAIEVAVSGMPAEHALLGILAMREGETGHGYELARSFGQDAPLGSVMRLEPGMVYHHLKKLERLGWVKVSADASPERPARRPFALSAAGRGELRRWLTEPVAHTREIRLEFLVKLYLALALEPALAVRLVDEQREMCARLIDALAEQRRRAEMPENAERDAIRFGEMVIDMRLAQTHAALAWLDRVRQDAGTAGASAANGDTGEL